jgi:hypothetical protein
MGGARRPPRRRPSSGEARPPKPTGKQPLSAFARFSISLGGLAFIVFDVVWFRRLLELLGVLSVPDELHKLWGIMMWSAAHILAWVPIAIGLTIICFANWQWLRSKIPNDLARYAALIALLIGVYFIPTEKYAANIEVRPATIPTTQPTVPENNSPITNSITPTPPSGDGTVVRKNGEECPPDYARVYRNKAGNGKVGIKTIGKVCVIENETTDTETGYDIQR